MSAEGLWTGTRARRAREGQRGTGRGREGSKGEGLEGQEAGTRGRNRRKESARAREGLRRSQGQQQEGRRQPCQDGPGRAAGREPGGPGRTRHSEGNSPSLDSTAPMASRAWSERSDGWQLGWPRRTGLGLAGLRRSGRDAGRLGHLRGLAALTAPPGGACSGCRSSTGFQGSVDGGSGRGDISRTAGAREPSRQSLRRKCGRAEVSRAVSRQTDAPAKSILGQCSGCPTSWPLQLRQGTAPLKWARIRCSPASPRPEPREIIDGIDLPTEPAMKTQPLPLASRDPAPPSPPEPDSWSEVSSPTDQQLPATRNSNSAGSESAIRLPRLLWP